MDNDGDKIGDDAYTIDGGENEDRAPLMKPTIYLNLYPPIIVLISPKNNSIIKLYQILTK